ncbi:MAG: DUF1838 family protein [Rhodospirillaceae bacterium]
MVLSVNSLSSLSRRNVLAGVAGVAATHVALQSRTGQAAEHFDPKDPVQVLRTLHRMRGSEDGRIAMGWLKGQRFGVVDAEIVPLMGMVTGTFARHKVLEDGSIELTSFELAFYTDFETGELIDTLKIPYTGKTVEVPKLKLGPSRSVVKPEFYSLREVGGETQRTASDDAMRPTGSMRFEHWLGPVTVKDGHVWITEASSAKVVPADPQASSVIYSEAVTYKGNEADVNNPDLPTLDSTLSYTGITSWRPWMEMGDHPGHTTSHALGSKSYDLDGLPDDYREMAEKHYPEAIANPGAILDQLG